MSREERRQKFIDSYKHELAGFVFEAMTHHDRSGGMLALWTREIMRRIDKRIGQMFDELAPAPVVVPQPEQTKPEMPKPHQNGTATPQRRTA